MENTPDVEPLVFWRQQIDPNHECPGDGTCPIPSGLYLLIAKDPEKPDDESAYITNMYVHQISAGQLVASMVNMLDRTVLDNRGDEPAMIAFTRGRDLLRSAVEQIAPPPEVSAEFNDFAMDNLDDWKGLIG